MIDQEEIDIRLKDFLAQHNIRAVEGPARGYDALETPYVTLLNGLSHEPGDLSNCSFRRPDEAIWRHFKAELLHWLAGRDLIVWRSPPKLEVDSVAEISGDLANHEAVMDGLEPPRLAQYKVEYYSIRCRLTAYRT